MTTGWERGSTDEGAAAHLWQLLVGLQAPLILLFLFTADWRKRGEIARSVALQFAALCVAVVPVALLRL